MFKYGDEIGDVYKVTKKGLSKVDDYVDVMKKALSKSGDDVNDIIKHGDDVAKGSEKSIDELIKTVSNSSQHSKNARWIPQSLKEKLALEQVLSNPSKGTIVNLRKGMTDTRWAQEDGWIKMTQNINGVEIHYVWNKFLNVFDDFKFK